MKKIFISLAAVLCLAASATAQTLIVVEEKPVLTNRRGARILPQAGDWSIGINTTPFFDYFGNMFTRGGTNVAPTFFGNGTGINAKYFFTDRQALRMGLNVNYGIDYFYGHPMSNTSPGDTVTDIMETTNQDFGIKVGYEWRRGRGRLQGFYGAEFQAMFSRTRTDYRYGNDMTNAHPNPWTWNFNTNTQSEMSRRTLSTKSSFNFALAAYGFVGVEYFFAPKISVGGELGLGIGYVNNGDSEYRVQRYDSTNNTVVEETFSRHDHTVPTNGFNIRTTTQGNIFINFYF